MADIFQLRRHLRQNWTVKRTAAASSVGWQGLKSAAPESESMEASVDGFASSSSSSCFLVKGVPSAAWLCGCGKRTFEFAGPWHDRERESWLKISNNFKRKPQDCHHTLEQQSHVLIELGVLTLLTLRGASGANTDGQICTAPVCTQRNGEVITVVFYVCSQITHSSWFTRERRSQHNRVTHIHAKVLIRPEDDLNWIFIVLNHQTPKKSVTVKDRSFWFFTRDFSLHLKLQSFYAHVCFCFVFFHLR